MKFWDSSALVPLFIREAHSPSISHLIKQDRDVVVWAMSDVEVYSAIHRIARSASVAIASLNETLRSVEEFWQDITIVGNVDAVRVYAKRLVSVHSLRAADAQQLAAALTFSFSDPRSLDFVCLDTRLAEAAMKEGFVVLPVSAG